MPTDNDRPPSNTKLIVTRWQALIRNKVKEWASSNGQAVAHEQFQQLVRMACNEWDAAEPEAKRYAQELLQEHNLPLASGLSGEFADPSPSGSSPVAPTSGKGPGAAGAGPPVPVEGDASGKVAATAAPTLPWCPLCRQSAAPQDKYCGKCGLSLQCPRCQRPFQVDHICCSICGLDMKELRQLHEQIKLFDEQMNLGHQFYQIACSPIPLVQGLDYAEKARTAFTNALGRTENQKARDGYRKATNKLVELLHLACDEARQAGQLGQAIELLHRMLREPCLQQIATERIQEIRLGRERQLKEAREEAGNSRWQKAMQVLAALAQQFPHDAEIDGLLCEFQTNLDEFRKKEAHAQEVVNKSIPKLREEKRIVAILRLLKELENSQVNVKNLAVAQGVFQQALDSADRSADLAERHWEAGHSGDALVEANRALEIVADHDRALAIKARIDEYDRLRFQLNREIKDKRWFRANRTLAHLHNGGLYAVQQQVIASALARANEFCRFVLWTVATGCLLLLATRMTGFFEKDLVLERLFGAGLRSVLGPAVTLTSLAICAFLLAAFVTCCTALIR